MTPPQHAYKNRIAWRAAQDLREGCYVNLGIGIPTLVSDYVAVDTEVIFQSENGILGVGPLATPEQVCVDLINASHQKITVVPGASYFDCAEAFLMLRGGHVDLALLGAYEVSVNGDLANWSLDQPGRANTVGGAMDIAAGARQIWALMQHCRDDGKPRLVEICRYPLTAAGVVRRIYTDLAVLEIVDGCFVVKESLESLSFEDLQQRTGAPFTFSPTWKPLITPF